MGAGAVSQLQSATAGWHTAATGCHVALQGTTWPQPCRPKQHPLRTSKEAHAWGLTQCPGWPHITTKARPVCQTWHNQALQGLCEHCSSSFTPWSSESSQGAPLSCGALSPSLQEPASDCQASSPAGCHTFWASSTSLKLTDPVAWYWASGTASGTILDQEAQAQSGYMVSCFLLDRDRGPRLRYNPSARQSGLDRFNSLDRERHAKYGPPCRGRQLPCQADSPGQLQRL